MFIVLTWSVIHYKVLRVEMAYIIAADRSGSFGGALDWWSKGC